MTGHPLPCTPAANTKKTSAPEHCVSDSPAYGQCSRIGTTAPHPQPFLLYTPVHGLKPAQQVHLSKQPPAGTHALHQLQRSSGHVCILTLHYIDGEPRKGPVTACSRLHGGLDDGMLGQLGQQRQRKHLQACMQPAARS